ncbi:MAG: polysaccharide deacetylase family protein [Chthoniobacterales bacterium]|nr:polysaccharide deacetylase family protein [Chthoniobacterales bacterium]
MVSLLIGSSALLCAEGIPLDNQAHLQAAGAHDLTTPADLVMPPPSVGPAAESPRQWSKPLQPTNEIAAPRVARVPATYNSVHTNRRVLALTFDDGPSAELTPKLLDLLKKEGVRATFFVIGSNVQAHPDIARRIVAEGHEIANHSWSHPQLPRLGAERLEQEIKNTTDIIEQTTGQRVTMMRPPYGAINERVKNAIIKTHGLDLLMWSVDPRDWTRPGPEAVERRLLAGAAPGAIMLCHDIHSGTIAAMPGTIAQLKAKGYSFATVSELLAMDEPRPPKPAVAKPKKV